jgi:hypothetical protein
VLDFVVSDFAEPDFDEELRPDEPWFDAFSPDDLLLEDLPPDGCGLFERRPFDAPVSPRSSMVSASKPARVFDALGRRPLVPSGIPRPV